MIETIAYVVASMSGVMYITSKTDSAIDFMLLNVAWISICALIYFS